MDFRIRYLGRVGYEEGLAEQESAMGRVIAGELRGEVLLLEHEPVYTIGRTRDKSSLAKVGWLPHPVYEISRGGQATYHGPGQLVGYPILDMGLFNRDLHQYLRWIEDFLVDLCGIYGVKAGRREGLTGCWVGERKVASIGVGVRRWVSWHGFALNVERRALEGFAWIVPCGIVGVRMTDLGTEAGRELGVEEVAGVCGRMMGERLGELVGREDGRLRGSVEGVESGEGFVAKEEGFGVD